MQESLHVAVIIPCYNEASAIAGVVRGFQAHLPGAEVFVYDNGSSDDTARVARLAGATVRTERRKGKGHVVRRMFADVEADVYVLVDGDDTYDPASAPVLVRTLYDNRCDMVSARRVSDRKEAYRPGHRIGNRVLTGLVSRLFGDEFEDLLSGYRVFSRRFVKSFPALSTGFETETELTVHALSLNMPVLEISSPYRERAEDSHSKLRTLRDGLRILHLILTLTKDERPLFFFSVVFAALATLSIGLAVPVVTEWIETGLVPRFPTAILSTGIMLLAFLSLSSGVVLSSVTRARREAKRLRYLAIPWLKPGTQETPSR